MNRTVLHAGLPKTGTTVLQQVVFAKTPDLEYLGPPYRDKRGHFFLKQMFGEVDADRLDLAAIRRHLAAYEDRARRRNVPFVVSDEAIGNTTTVPRSEKLGRFDAALPGATWIFGIRRPLDLLESLYLWEMRCIEFNTGRFFRPFEKWFAHRWARFDRNHISVLAIGELLEEALRRFGRERVTVLPLEWLRDRPQQYHETLGRIIGVAPAMLAEVLGRERRNDRMTQLQFDFVSLLTKQNFAKVNRLREHVISFLDRHRVPLPAGLTCHFPSEDSRPARKAIFRLFDHLGAVDPQPVPKRILVPDAIQAAVLRRTEPALRRADFQLGLDLATLGYFDHPAGG